MRQRARQLRQPTRASLATLTLVTTALTLTGCDILMAGPTPPKPPRETIEVPPEETTVYVEGGGADDNFPIFVQILDRVAQETSVVTGREMVDQFETAGFDTTTMQVSRDRTRTDLDPESMFVSARFGEECLVGQLVMSDRSISAEVMPAVGPTNDICIIGLTQPIDW